MLMTKAKRLFIRNAMTKYMMAEDKAQFWYDCKAGLSYDEMCKDWKALLKRLEMEKDRWEYNKTHPGMDSWC